MPNARAPLGQAPYKTESSASYVGIAPIDAKNPTNRMNAGAPVQSSQSTVSMQHESKNVHATKNELLNMSSYCTIDGRQNAKGVTTI